MELAFTCFWVLFLMFSATVVDGQLIEGYYEHHGCPQAEDIVKTVVTNVVQQDRSLAAALLRLHFHDCFVRVLLLLLENSSFLLDLFWMTQGCDASILLDPVEGEPPVEKQSVPNLSLRGYKAVDAMKAALEQACPGIVSCADILALAARDAVYLVTEEMMKETAIMSLTRCSVLGFKAGGGFWSVPTGRLDGRVSLSKEADRWIPPTSESSEELTQRFLDVGLTQDEMITLSGAHTIGQAHCVSFINRLYPETDPSLDPVYAAQLKQACPMKPNPRTVVPLDPVTPYKFDNNYYRNLASGMGLMISDQTLHEEIITTFSARLNAEDSNMWHTKFGNAMNRMGAINVKLGAEGEVRKYCRHRN